jgi:hypothetical protein
LGQGQAIQLGVADEQAQLLVLVPRQPPGASERVSRSVDRAQRVFAQSGIIEPLVGAAPHVFSQHDGHKHRPPIRVITGRFIVEFLQRRGEIRTRRFQQDGDDEGVQGAGPCGREDLPGNGAVGAKIGVHDTDSQVFARGEVSFARLRRNCGAMESAANGCADPLVFFLRLFGENHHFERHQTLEQCVDGRRHEKTIRNAAGSASSF